MKKSLLAFLIAGMVTLTDRSGSARAATAFDDQICPNVNDAGSHLNTLVDTSKLLTDDLVAAAQAMVDGYRVCMRGYDDNTYNQAEASGQQHTNGTGVGRVYARLALARSLQRIGEYAADAKKYADAKSAYDEALKHLDEMKSIPAIDAMGGLGDSPEHRLIVKGDAVRTSIESEEAALPKP